MTSISPNPSPLSPIGVDVTAGRPLPESPEGLRRAAQAFEAVFLRYLLGELRKSIPTAGETSYARTVYEGMYDDVLARHLASAGGIGLSRLLIEQLGPQLQAGKAGESGGGRLDTPKGMVYTLGDDLKREPKTN
ncbi:MAG TPA: rod-binding protein [Limnochordia bacterium]